MPRTTGPIRKPSRSLRAYSLLALPSAAVVLAWWLSLHPFGGSTMVFPLAAYCAVILIRPDWWLILLPALWPIADLARWSGQIHVTESDALALGTVATLSFQALITRRWPHAVDSAPFRAGITAWASMALLAAATVVAVARGMSEFPPESFEAWTGYSGSMNAIRVGKGFLLPMMLLPFLHAALRRDGRRAFERLAAGLALGLGAASLAALWERVAFPGLTDFAADYRTTALFWEMHVGGAALDGWLALTLPFAVFSAWRWRRSPAILTAMLAILALASYAILTTFSRGLYLGIMVGAVTLGVAALVARTDVEKAAGLRPIVAIGATGLAAFAIAAIAFRHGGYRGAAAMLLTGGLAYALVGRLSGLRAGEVVAALGLAAVIAGASTWFGSLFPKGPYVMFALAWAAGAGMTWHLWHGAEDRGWRVLGFAIFGWALFAAVGVPVNWGGEVALPDSIGAAVLIAIPAIAQAASRRRLWTPNSSGILAAGALGIASLLAAAVFGSNFFQARAATTGADLAGRLQHWRNSMSLVDTDTERLLGIGAGRYSEAYFWKVPKGQIPGTWRIIEEPGNTFLRLGPPKYMRGFGELFRVTQAVPLDMRGPFLYRFRARAPADSVLRFEVCRKHLLYTHDCVIRTFGIKGGDRWQSFSGATERGALDPGAWYAPRLASLSLDLDGDAPVDVDDLEVADGQARAIVRNGTFDWGPALWFFTSDKQHLPWHAKNMALHAYVEGGMLGLVALGSVIILGLGRVSRRMRSKGPAAAVLLASLLAFLTVGLFDSLIDVPRLSFWLVIVLWLALVLRRDLGSQQRISI